MYIWAMSVLLVLCVRMENSIFLCVAHMLFTRMYRRNHECTCVSTAHPDDDLEFNKEIISFTLKTCTKRSLQNKVSCSHSSHFLIFLGISGCLLCLVSDYIEHSAVHLTNSFSILQCQCGFMFLDFLRQSCNIKKKVSSLIGRRARKKFIGISNIDWHGGKKGRGKKYIQRWKEENLSAAL